MKKFHHRNPNPKKVIKIQNQPLYLYQYFSIRRFPDEANRRSSVDQNMNSFPYRLMTVYIILYYEFSAIDNRPLAILGFTRQIALSAWVEFLETAPFLMEFTHTVEPFPVPYLVHALLIGISDNNKIFLII